MKKVLSLMMVLAIVLSMLSLSVFATASNVEPYANAAVCGDCGGNLKLTTKTETGNAREDASCDGAFPLVHYHRVDKVTIKSSCASCGFNNSETLYRLYCETIGKYIG